MNLADALTATASDRGPRSFLEQFLEDIAGTEHEATILAELRGPRQAAHLARALTLLARSNGTIPTTSTISGASVTKWRESQ